MNRTVRKQHPRYHEGCGTNITLMISSRLGLRQPLYSSNGRYLFCSNSRNVTCFSMTTGEAVFSLEGHIGDVTGMCLHPSNPANVVTSSLDGTIRTWDGSTGEQISILHVGKPVSHIASVSGSSENFNNIFAAIIDKDLDLNEHAEDYPLGNEPACLRPRAIGSAFSFAVGPDGKRKAPPKMSVVEIDIVLNHIVRVILHKKEGFITGLISRILGNKNADVCCCFSIRRSLYIWRANTFGSMLIKYKQQQLISSMAVSPVTESGFFICLGDPVGRISTIFPEEVKQSYALDSFAELKEHDSSSPVVHVREVLSTQKKGKGKLLESNVVFSKNANSFGYIPTAGSELSQVTSVHWHAHTVWSLEISPDSSYLISGGEEGVAVLWKLAPTLPNGEISSIAGPSTDKSHRTYIPRLGSTIRSIVAFADLGNNHSSRSEKEDTAMSQLPPLSFAIVTCTNMLSTFNLLTIRRMWSFQGIAIGGMPAIVTSNVIASLLRYAKKFALKQGIVGDVPFLPGDRATILSSCSRQLVKGVIVDPRTKSIVVNNVPERSSLQWWSLSAMQEVYNLEVSPRNSVSRIDADPATPTRIIHAAFSWDGLSLVTVETSTTLDDLDSTIMKFWEWKAEIYDSNSRGRFECVTKVDSPHKGGISTLEYHPQLHLVVTGGDDRTFKLWERVSTIPALTIAEHEAVKLRKKAFEASLNDDEEEDDDDDEAESNNENRSSTYHTTVQASITGLGTTVAGPLNRKARRENARKQSALGQVQAKNVIYSWNCRSVGFYRDWPVSASAFSGDGSTLALGYGHHITLWDWKDNTLKNVLVAIAPGPTMQKGSHAFSYSPITSLSFAGLSSKLIVTTTTSLTVWDTIERKINWRYVVPGEIHAFSSDRIGLSCSPRFSVITSSHSSFVALLFDVFSPTPLAMWNLPQNKLTSLVAKTNPYNIKNVPYAISFIPSAVSRSQNKAALAHDILIADPTNDFYRFSTPAFHVADCNVSVISQKSIVDGKKSLSGGSILPSASYDASGVVSSESFAKESEVSLTHHDVRSSARLLNSMLSSFGPSITFPEPAALYDSLIGNVPLALPSKKRDSDRSEEPSIDIAIATKRQRIPNETWMEDGLDVECTISGRIFETRDPGNSVSAVSKPPTYPKTASKRIANEVARRKL
jgi:WD40 repeat protein